MLPCVRLLTARDHDDLLRSVAAVARTWRARFGRSSEIAVERRPSGRPVLVGVLPGEPIDVSLSHADDLHAAALLLGSGGRVGVDLERVGRIRHSHLPYFASEEEQALLSLAPEPTALWCAKEAGFKALSAEGAVETLTDVAVEFVSLNVFVFESAAGGGIGHVDCLADRHFLAWAVAE